MKQISEFYLKIIHHRTLSIYLILLNRRWLKLWQETMVEITSKTAGVIASQPLHVITLRIMAQFVGREIQYRLVYA